jgi:membrane associated rhomboid family serine protease
MSITLIIVIATAIVSYLGFTRQELVYKYILNPYQVVHHKQYYRIISHGFLHADWMHLGFNMLALYSFGITLEHGGYFQKPDGVIEYIPGFDDPSVFGKNGPLYFVLLYFLGMIFSSIYSIAKHKDNHGYNSLGASGAVSAVVFASILLHPNGEIGFFFIPMPSILFGIIYLVLSAYMSRKGHDNIGHDAHFWGSVFGFVFPIVMKPELLPRFINLVQQLL